MNIYKPETVLGSELSGWKEEEDDSWMVAVGKMSRRAKVRESSNFTVGENQFRTRAIVLARED